jgi:hypothetical protein
LQHLTSKDSETRDLCRRFTFSSLHDSNYTYEEQQPSQTYINKYQVMRYSHCSISEQSQKYVTQFTQLLTLVIEDSPQMFDHIDFGSCT